MSLDAAQILAPFATGLLPAAAPSPAGEASGGGDFAILLESLAGVLQAARASSQGMAPTEDAPGNARTSAGAAAAPSGLGVEARAAAAPSGLDIEAGTAAAPSGVGIEAGAALVLELPAIPGLPAAPAPARLALGLAFSLETPAPDGPELPTEAKGEPTALPDGAAQDSTAALLLASLSAPVARATSAPAPESAEAAAAPQPAASPALAARPSPPQVPADPAGRQAPQETGARAADPAKPAAVLAEAAPTPAPRTAESSPAPALRPAEATAPVSGDAASPGPATPAFALASGVVAVTGRRIAPSASATESPAAPTGPVAAAAAAPTPESRTPVATVASLLQPETPADPAQAPDAPPPEVLATLAARPEARPEARSEARPAEGRRREATAGRPEPIGLRSASGAAPALAVATEVPATQDRITPVAMQARPMDGPASRPSGEGDDLFALAEPAERAEPATAPAGPAVNASPDARGAAAPAVEAPPLPPRAGAETIAALAAQMARRLDDGITRFDLELNPGDLGRVDVRLEIDASGAVRAAFTFEHAHAARELGQRADELQKSLESAGFNLSGGLSFDVSGDRSQGRSMAWSDGREGRAQPQQPSAPEPSRELPGDIAEALNGRQTAARSGVDIRI